MTFRQVTRQFRNSRVRRWRRCAVAALRSGGQAEGGVGRAGAGCGAAACSSPSTPIASCDRVQPLPSAWSQVSPLPASRQGFLSRPQFAGCAQSAQPSRLPQTRSTRVSKPLNPSRQQRGQPLQAFSRCSQQSLCFDQSLQRYARRALDTRLPSRGIQTLPLRSLPRKDHIRAPWGRKAGAVDPGWASCARPKDPDPDR